ncbi:GNAT family N-acetyltransferase [Chloroflexota bacterium]
MAFRKLQLDDLELLHAWLNTPHVSRWYGCKLPTYEQVFQKYAPRIKGQIPTQTYLILVDETPIGYIQTYRMSDHPEYNAHVEADEHTAGLDLFIGQADLIHKGFGTAILTRFLADVVFKDQSISSCVVGPEPDNLAAIRCYEKVGFRYYRTIHQPSEPQGEILMRIIRSELNS